MASPDTWGSWDASKTVFPSCHLAYDVTVLKNT
eukprot:CAMPEP_0184379648 /NCGR_PEP_ID=MMETSP0007-20130409/4040_1 /TAXON_ID=97485 /ORGANISM="Prymnesium parvum, Strain Texoma1" /LENGTH=32 /DNA_ID= /DNA_START= /DNA_END= /DNA_ORIENTATION=